MPDVQISPSECQLRRVFGMTTPKVEVNQQRAPRAAALGGLGPTVTQQAQDSQLYCWAMAIELNRERWEPRPGATATAEEFIAARSVLQEIHSLMGWSPWVMEDRAQEYDAAAVAASHLAPPRTKITISGSSIRGNSGRKRQPL